MFLVFLMMTLGLFVFFLLFCSFVGRFSVGCLPRRDGEWERKRNFMEKTVSDNRREWSTVVGFVIQNVCFGSSEANFGQRCMSFDPLWAIGCDSRRFSILISLVSPNQHHRNNCPMKFLSLRINDRVFRIVISLCVMFEFFNASITFC